MRSALLRLADKYSDRLDNRLDRAFCVVHLVLLLVKSQEKSLLIPYCAESRARRHSERRADRKER